MAEIDFVNRDNGYISFVTAPAIIHIVRMFNFKHSEEEEKETNKIK